MFLYLFCNWALSCLQKSSSISSSSQLSCHIVSCVCLSFFCRRSVPQSVKKKDVCDCRRRTEIKKEFQHAPSSSNSSNSSSSSINCDTLGLLVFVVSVFCFFFSLMLFVFEIWKCLEFQNSPKRRRSIRYRSDSRELDNVAVVVV